MAVEKVKLVSNGDILIAKSGGVKFRRSLTKPLSNAFIIRRRYNN